MVKTPSGGVVPADIALQANKSTPSSGATGTGTVAAVAPQNGGGLDPASGGSDPASNPAIQPNDTEEAEDANRADAVIAEGEKLGEGCKRIPSAQTAITMKLEELIKEQKYLETVTNRGLRENGGPGLFPPAETPWQRQLLKFDGTPEPQLMAEDAENEEIVSKKAPGCQIL